MEERVKIPAGYEVGEARADELEQLAQIEIAAAAIFAAEDLSAGAAEPMPLTALQEAASARRLLVARSLVTGIPVGFALVTPLDGEAHLHEIDVHPSHARRGLGRVLVDRAARCARAQGAARMTLTTFRHVPWNMPFYERLGFCEVPEHEQGPELRALRVREAERGMDPRRRVALQLDLSAY
jgi:GNAT superfamily N-acetyltransferase